ncbi:hypothetical protein [Persicobacter sp. CCB-QB2]|uniref:hypothetical protein n=1 Tax=Persicobacter sp. CCB-QB2 TaxID=1561025 RepID=UPI0012F93A6B|nr:hypothetical protein [Persicobacter sp. CCB-QB2]
MKRKIPFSIRLPNRVVYLSWPFRSLLTTWNNFLPWRSNALWRANITGQTLALESNLNRHVSGSQNSIYIIEGSPLSRWISLISEQADVFEPGLLPDEEPEEIGLSTENSGSLGVSFRVMAPSTADVLEIQNIVETFRIVGKTYDIVTFVPGAGIVTSSGHILIDHNQNRITYG